MLLLLLRRREGEPRARGSGDDGLAVGIGGRRDGELLVMVMMMMLAVGGARRRWHRVEGGARGEPAAAVLLRVRLGREAQLGVRAAGLLLMLLMMLMMLVGLLGIYDVREMFFFCELWAWVI